MQLTICSTRFREATEARDQEPFFFLLLIWFCAAGIRDNAGRLGSQARALNDAGAALKDQTKKLVAAAADALKNKVRTAAEWIRKCFEFTFAFSLFRIRRRRRSGCAG